LGGLPLSRLDWTFLGELDFGLLVSVPWDLAALFMLARGLLVCD